MLLMIVKMFMHASNNSGMHRSITADFLMIGGYIGTFLSRYRLGIGRSLAIETS